MKFGTHIQVREEKFGAVIFETLKEKVFVTNQTGAEIVRLLREGKTRETIVKELAIKYGTDAAALNCDVTEFIDNMTKHEVLV